MADDLSERPSSTRRRARKTRSILRTNQALTLAASGKTNEEIAQAITENELKQGTGTGITARGVAALITRALERYEVRDADAIERVRAEQLERLARMRGAVWGKALDGNMRAIDRVVAIERTTAKIAGTEAPPEAAGNAAQGILSSDELAALRGMEAAFRDAAAHTITLPPSDVLELPSGGEASLPIENATEVHGGQGST